MTNHAKRNTAALILLAAALCILAGAWRWTPLSRWLDPSALASWLQEGRAYAAPWIVLAAYVLGSQIMFPLVVLILATAYAFGPWLGFLYALVGSIAGALVTYGLGSWIGQDGYRRWVGSRFPDLDRLLHRQALLAVVATHLFPVGPFTLVNLAAGAAGVGLGRFTLGCAIGVLPGIALTTLLEGVLELALARPGLLSGGLAVGAALAAGAFLLWSRPRKS